MTRDSNSPQSQRTRENSVTSAGSPYATTDDQAVSVVAGRTRNHSIQFSSDTNNDPMIEDGVINSNGANGRNRADSNAAQSSPSPQSSARNYNTRRVHHQQHHHHHGRRRSRHLSQSSANTNISDLNHLSSSSDNLLAPKPVPRDRYKLVWFGFTILGITTLLPWNFFITATDYWMFKFRNVTSAYDPHKPHETERTPLQTFFESYLAIAANFPMLASMIINSLYGQRFSQKRRLYVSLTAMLIIFAATTIFVHIDTDQMQTAFFAITLAMVVVVSFFSAIFQAAIFGIVASFPNNCMHAMVNGQAVAGLLAVFIQIVSMLNNTGPVTSGLWYFMASTIFLAFATLCYWSMDNDYTRYYLVKLPDEDELSTSLSVNFIEDKWEIMEALKDCWQMAAVVIVSFWASLAVFPGVCVLVVPETPNISIFTGRFYTTITTFLLFNFGDLAGRVCSTYLPFPSHRKNLLLGLTVARSIFPLTILFCNVHPRNNTPVLLQNDLYFPILNTLSALTNGYVFSSAMVAASDQSQKHRLELTGFVMASALGIGLTLGSVSSTILLTVI